LNPTAVPSSVPPRPAAEAPAAGAPAIALRGVTKLYRRTEGRAGTLKENLLASLSRRERRDLITALDDVNLEVAPGDSIGLIGPNGSGKSTLLKLIAGITQPTRGTVATRGTVLGLIELGAGFHPDLTGVENIRLQGAIYGFGAREVEAQIDSILDFAGLSDFRHMPVRHYSSGMYMRLGFAIAVHARPDILLVDEVMAVGDQDFQERCLRAIKRLRAEGMTLVLVTHFPEHIERICDRVAWIDGGRIVRLGPAGQILAAYQRDLIERRYARSAGPLDTEAMTVGAAGRFGSEEARIEAVRLLDADGRPCMNFRRGAPMTIELDYTARPGIEAVDLTIPLEAIDRIFLTVWRAETDGALGRPAQGRGRFRLEIASLPLLPGRYGITFALSPPGRPSDHYSLLYKMFIFSVEPEPGWDTIAPLELKPALTILP